MAPDRYAALLSAVLDGELDPFIESYLRWRRTNSR